MPYKFPQDYAAMRDECVEVARASGWQDKPISFLTAMALLHSEASEALEAWRERGMASWMLRKLNAHESCSACRDQTDFSSPECPDHPDKPEGVGSELADVLIRLLHYDGYFGLDLEKIHYEGVELPYDDFAENIAAMHRIISWIVVYYEYANEITSSVRSRSAELLAFLAQFAERYGIDLNFEYNRKIEYNRKRSYRHGNKRA